MAAIWGQDETGVLVVANLAKANARAARRATPPPARMLPGLARTPATPSLLADLPDELPAPRAHPRAPLANDRPFGAAIAGRDRGSGLGRGLGVVVVALILAGGGFALGAFTIIGGEAEVMVLGPIPAPTPEAAADPGVGALQADLDRTAAALAAQERANDAIVAAHAAEHLASFPVQLPSTRLELRTEWRGPVRAALPQKHKKKKKKSRSRDDD